MKYQVMLHSLQYTSKQELRNNTGYIKNTIMNDSVCVTMSELARAMVAGHTAILGYLEYSKAEQERIANGKRIGASDKHWKHQQVFALDFDNKGKNLSIEQALQIAESANVSPAFIYTTQSHRKDHPRFRMVFALDRLINSEQEYRQIIAALFSVFVVNGEYVVDAQCSDLSRMFYPGREIVYENYNATVQASKLLNMTVENLPVKSTAKATTKTITVAIDTEMIRAIKLGDPKKYRKLISERLSTLENTSLEGCRPFSKQNTKYSLLYKDYLSKLKDYCFENSKKPAKPAIMRTPDDYYDYFSQFPLDILLGLPMNTNIHCILPTHHDNSPSAQIMQTDDGNYMYHCYGCGGNNKFLDVFNVIEAITGWKHRRTKEFLNKTFNVQYETEWMMERKQDITDYQDYVFNDLEEHFPWLYKRLKRNKNNQVLNMFLTIGRHYVYDHKMTGCDKTIFALDLNTMLKRMKDFGDSVLSKASLHKRLKLFERLGFIEIINNKDIPGTFKETLLKLQAKKHYKYRTNVFAIPSFSTDLLVKIQEKWQADDVAGIRNQHYCREAELRANGKDSANKIFVQDHSKDITPYVEDFYQVYRKVAKRVIKAKGWITEKILLQKIKGYDTAKKQKLSGICLPQLLRELELRRVSYNKELEEQLNIKPGTLRYGASRIIIPQS